MKNTLRFATLMLWSLVAAAVEPHPADEQPAPAASVPDLDDRAALEQFLDGVFDVGMHEHHVTGAVISIVKDGQLLFAKGYGHRNIEKNLPVDPRTTLFRIGSTTKLMTWTAVMQLVEQGKLDLDADVNTYLKDPKVPDGYGKPVTLRQIMTHTAGFEEGFLGYLINDDPLQQLPIAETLKKHMPARVRPPGVMSSYSNHGAALAGLIVEQVSGTPYNDYIAKHILEPLDMQFATVQEPVPERLRPYLAIGYKQENGAPVPKKYEIVGGFRPAGSGAASAIDMAHFMIAHLADGRYEDREILQSQTAQQMHTTAYQLDSRLPGMALGFYHGNVNGLDVIGHGGDTSYCHTELMLIPSRQVGFFASFYTDDSRVRERVTEAFFDRYFPEREAHPKLVPDAVEAAQRYAGSYQFTRRNFSKIEKLLGLASQLSVAALPNGNLVLAGFGPDPWQFRPVDVNLYRQIDGKAMMTFRSDSAGRPTHMFFDFLPFMPTERTSWYERSSMWFTALGVVFLVFFGQLIRAFYLRREIKAAPPPQRKAERLATGVAVWAFVTIGGLGLVVGLVGFETLFSHIPSSLKVALVMPLVFVVLTVLLLITAVRVWRERFWTINRRVVFSLVTLAAVTLSLFFWQWNLLGWRFG